MKRTKFNRMIALLFMIVLLNSLLLSLTSTVFAEEESETIYIETVEDFMELAQHCTLDTWSQGKTVVLQTDISLADAELSTIPIFGGVFDGNGHTISGLEITQSMTPAGLFGILLETAVVKNLKVSGSSISAKNGGNVGGIVGENYGMVVDCSFSGNVLGDTNVGGIVGINTISGQVIQCNANGSVSGNKMTGGITGYNLGIVGECQNNAYVNTSSVDTTISPEDIDIDFSMDVSKLYSMDTSTSASDTGGIAGYSSGIVSNCTNNAPIGYPHIGYNVGGIIGRNCGYIHSCENNKNVFGRKDVGGIVGQMEPYIAQNITESTLAKLEQQLNELNVMLDTVLNDANGGVGTVTARLNRIADYMDSAAGAASDIRTYGAVTSTVTGSGEADSSASATITPPQVEVEGGGGTAGGAGAVITPGGGVAGGGVVSGGEIQGGLTESSAEGESQASASGNISASTQITMTTSLSGLSSAIYGMSGQIRLLNGEIAGTSGTLTEDMKAIQKQINTISDTALELFQGDGEGDILVDSSEIDIELITLGKASDCKNYGSVNGDINVGGIAGAMAMEYELDPEDDISFNLDGTQRRKLELKAIIQECVNTGKVIAKRSYAGGICGRMDLGLIAQSEGYGNVISENGNYVGGIAGLTSSIIRQCFAKCTLSGEKYIGGIVGSGVAENLTGDASTVAGCYSMVSIEAYKEFAGAISGVNTGNFVENYFISDTLTGINGRSYSGKAEPIAYEDLLKTEETTEESASALEIPEAFLQFTLTFVVDEETIKTVPFEYGESFDETVYPEISAKDGYYVHWDKTELQNLNFDTVITASYTPYVSALSNTETRTDGRPIFFIEGQFDDEANAAVTVVPNTPDNFDNLVENWKDFLGKSFSDMKVSCEIVEQWKISIPDDGQETHTIRYLSPNANPDNLDIYVKEANSWKEVNTEMIGSYLTFDVQSSDIEIAVIRTTNVWWIWLLGGIVLLILALLLLRFIRKIVKSKKWTDKKASNENKDTKTEETEDKPEASYAAPKKKKRWLMPLMIVLAFFVGIGGTAAFFLLPDLMNGVKAYDLLKKYSEKQELSMELTVNAQIDSQNCDFTALVERTNVEGHQVTVISQDKRKLYYCDGVVFLENGTAYQVSESFPDYLQLLDQAITLYQHVDIEEKDGTYTITAEREDARAILELLIPSVDELLADTYSVQVELLTEEGEVSELHFSGNGILNTPEKIPFDVSAVLSLNPENQNQITIPEPVRDTIISGEYETAGTLTDDFIRILNAWQTLNRDEFIHSSLLLKADCGPVTLNDHLDYYRWNDNGMQISSIQKNGYALYFTDTTICNQNGKIILAADAANIEAAKLLDIAYEACLNATLECREENGQYIYSLSLDEEGMKTVVYAIAPEAEKMDITFDSGSIQVVVGDDQIQSVNISCGGNVQIVLSSADVVFEAKMEFKQDVVPTELPEAVKKTLEE
ncbi:MAG: hypothetical protein ACI4C1_02285 [Lachnospiraceae bacterium]